MTNYESGGFKCNSKQGTVMNNNRVVSFSLSEPENSCSLPISLGL